MLDDFNREGLGIEVDFSLPAQSVIRSLNKIIEWRGKPGTIGVDNGPEYISCKQLIWAEKQGITIQHIQPGQPLGSRLIKFYSWKSMVAATAVAERKTMGHLSYRVATRRQSLSLPNMISMRLRFM